MILIKDLLFNQYMYIYNMSALSSNSLTWDNPGLLNPGVRLPDVEGVEDRGCDSWAASIPPDIEDSWEDGGLAPLRCVGDSFFSSSKASSASESIAYILPDLIVSSK